MYLVLQVPALVRFFFLRGMRRRRKKKDRNNQGKKRKTTNARSIGRVEGGARFESSSEGGMLPVHLAARDQALFSGTSAKRRCTQYESGVRGRPARRGRKKNPRPKQSRSLMCAAARRGKQIVLAALVFLSFILFFSLFVLTQSDFVQRRPVLRREREREKTAV